MPVSSGPDLLGENNLAFAYDTGDVINSYKGQPTTNLANFDIANSNFSTDTPSNLSQTANSSEATFQGRLSRKMVVLGGGFWNCYIFGYNTGVSSTNFAVSYKIKTLDGSHPNTIIGGGYIYGSAGSFFPAPVFTYLYDNWYQVTLVYSGTSMILNSLTGMYGSGGPKTFYITDYQAEALPYSTPFTPAGTTRSATQGLLPLVGTNTIDLTNVSFDSNAQMVFDGTNDYLTISDSTSLQFGDVFTVNAWVNPTNLNARYGVFTTRRFNTAGSWQFEVGTASGGTNRVAVTGLGTWIFETPNNVISPNVWTNICFVKPGNGVRGGTLYINGNEISPLVTTPYTILNNSDVKVIGSGTNLGQFFPGRIANVSLYNRILTSIEVRNNYSDFKTRFNLI
jgi:hypothetical protein